MELVSMSKEKRLTRALEISREGEQLVIVPVCYRPWVASMVALANQNRKDLLQ